MGTVRLLKSLLTNWSQYQAELPYNLNWAINGELVRDFLVVHPLVVADIGARGNAIPELTDLAPFIRYYAFEADSEECAKLNRQPPLDCFTYECFPHFIGASREATPFNLYSDPGYSSVYEIEEAYEQRFLDRRIYKERVVSVNPVSLDVAVTSHRLSFPSFIKVDTQGSELDILQSAPACLAQALMVEAEVEFVSIYRSQPLFIDLHKFMTEQGFELLYLNRAIGQRRNVYSGPARGQLVFGDALYGLSDSGWDSRSPGQLAQYAILLINYGHIDIACQIFDSYPKVRAVCPNLAKWFHRKERPAVLRALLAQFDKLLCLGLHLRRFNQMRFDSDRSWPIR